MYNMNECHRNNTEWNKQDTIDNITVWLSLYKLNRENKYAVIDLKILVIFWVIMTEMDHNKNCSFVLIFFHFVVYMLYTNKHIF